MKNQILTFLLGVFVAISIAASTSNLIETKPAVPKSIICKYVDPEPPIFDSTNPSGIRKYIEENRKQGYIVQSITYLNNDSMLIVMAKY